MDVLTVPTVTMATIITDISSIVTAAIGWVGDFIEGIVAQPLLMIFICIPLVGLAIGLIKRMIQL